MFGTTLHDILASHIISIEEKARAFKCFKQIIAFDIKSKMSLQAGDVVTISGLKMKKSLNGQSGVLTGFKNGRWAVPSLAAWVRPVNIIKDEWKMDREFNTFVSHEGKTYILRIEHDQTVRCITPKGISGHLVRVKFPWDDIWMEGFNHNAPEISELVTPK
jgi:hypothetical protein